MAEYPLPKFRFQVTWGGARLSFTEVTGLDMQQEVIEYRHSNSKDSSKQKMPGMLKYSNLTLKQGTFPGEFDFYTFFSEAHNDRENKRRDITITLLDEKHEPVMVWKASRAFAVKVQASDLKSDGNEVAIQTLEIAHEGLSLVK